MHPKFPRRSVFAPTPKLLERQYALRLVIFPCQYFPSPSPSFQPISSVAVLHILPRRIYLCCTAYHPPSSSAAVFTADLFFRPYYPESPPCLHFYPPTSLLRSLLHYLTSFLVLRRRCLSTFSDCIFSLLCVFPY